MRFNDGNWTLFGSSSTGARAASAHLPRSLDRGRRFAGPGRLGWRRGSDPHARAGADSRVRADLCRAELVPHAQAWDHAEELPRSLVGTLAEAGFLAAALPEELGGGGLDSVSYCLLCEELGKADSSVRGIVSVSNGLYGKTIAKWGSDEQRAEHLPGLASGESLGCYALTEPGCGSDAAALATRADRDGERLGADGLEGLHHARLVGGDGDRLRAHAASRGRAGSRRFSSRRHRTVSRPRR